MNHLKIPLLLLTILSLVLRVDAQHIHIQTSYSPAAGWDVFWYDFEAGAFPAGDFTQPIAKAARGQIPNDVTLTNALGGAGNPVWTLPQVEAGELPSLGFGTQGSGSFVSGQIQLRLVTFSGPGNFAIYTTGAFGEANLILTTRDGVNAADVVPLQFPGGHIHVNWCFTRPGLYQLGWRAEGTLTGGQFTNSAIIVFQFQVASPAPPVLKLAQTNATQTLKVETEGNVPLRVEASTNLTHWNTLPTFWLQPTVWTWTNVITEPTRFYRAVHNFP